MLQAHSLLWHYLWLGPHILQLALAALLCRRGLARVFPVFLSYIVFEAMEEFVLYAMDVLPWVRAETFWRTFAVGLVLEGLLRFAVIGELFLSLLRRWPAVAAWGNRLIVGVGAVLVLMASLAAAYTHIDHPQFQLISRAHILEQALYIIQSGLIVFVFLFSAHFKLRWNHQSFGIALGFGLISCEHLAAWAVAASGALIDRRHLLDFLNMATYHLAVLIWFSYLLFPQKSFTTSAVSLPEHNLDIWNRELERLLQP
jgi:hypothetical protein